MDIFVNTILGKLCRFKAVIKVFQLLVRTNCECMHVLLIYI